MTTNFEKTTKNTLRNCLEEQLCEFELLKSMYPEPDEIILFDKKVLGDIKNFLDNETDYTPTHLDFVLKLSLNSLKLEVCINLPSLYPIEEPDIYIRCNQLNRQQQTNLNTQLSKHIKENYLGEVCLHTALSWLQENIDIFHTSKVEEVEQTVNNAKVENFVRLWIFSHHIYNKRNREDIVTKAKELNLTGFCLPGKPGVICVEGLDSDCKEWWKDIKSMNWKRIIIRKTETFPQSEQVNEQKFRNFEEIHFSNPSNKTTKHADMSGFSKYMEENGLTEVFNDFFGLCNNV